MPDSTEPTSADAAAAGRAMFDDPRKATAMAGGVVGALLIALTHILAFYNIDITPDLVSALQVILIAIAGYFVHPAKEDLAALHARILAGLNYRPPTPAAPAIAPSAADLLRKLQ